MNSLRVWIRPNGDFCRVRVDSKRNARRLLDCLSQSFVFKTFDSISEEDESPFRSFLVPYNPPPFAVAFVKLLAAIPEVRLMSEPCKLVTEP
jgi:hypothetical protein